MSPTAREQCLVLILRTVGIVCLLALVPLFMPRDWIARTHEWMGLGPFPVQPIAEYLARSTSGLSAFYGGLLLIFSTDIRRYSRAIRYQAVAILFLSLCGVALGTRAGLPLVWVGLDAIACFLYCIPTLWLLRQLQIQDTTNREN
ncbi:MAG TPA: hypothetical protein VMM56_17570 [Planctomycetaceae bacterium]|nr:hypothetical protein [Planctomycetaceae bacterium]